MRHSVWSNWEIKDGSSENLEQSSQVKQSNSAKKEGIITES